MLLDLSKSFSPTDVTALRMADVILVIAQLELSSLRNVVRMMLTLGNDPELAHKVQIVLNRVGMESDITVKKAEETMGKPIFWQMPNDAKSMCESRNHGIAAGAARPALEAASEHCRPGPGPVGQGSAAGRQGRKSVRGSI